MNYRTFEKTGQKVSLLGFGAMRFPTVNGEIEPIQSQKMIDLAYENGVNYYDTAYGYHDGKSQSFLGQALKKYPRDSFFITNKLPIWACDTPEDLERVFQDQLEKCQVTYFDFYLLHALDSEKYAKCEKLGAYDFIKDKQAQGKIKNIGFSFHDTPECLEKICSEHQWDFAQLQINYLDWEYQQAKEQYEILCKYNIPCVVMEPARGGALSNLSGDANQVLLDYAPNQSITSWAMKYVASLPNVLTVLSGMSLEEHVLDNIKTFDEFQPLTDEEQALIQKALTIHKKTSLIPCTECKYCIDCPASVNIPEMFKIYNNYMLSKYKDGFVNARKEKSDCDDSLCIECGACMEKCPQKIAIPQRLKEIGALFQEFTK